VRRSLRNALEQPAVYLLKPNGVTGVATATLGQFDWAAAGPTGAPAH